LVCADYSFESGRATVLPEPPWLWLDALSRDLGTLRGDEIEWTGPQLTGRFWLTLHETRVQRRSDGPKLQFESLPLPWQVTITAEDTARGEAEVTMVLGPCFRITQVDRQGIPVPYSEISYVPAPLATEAGGYENWAVAHGIRTDAGGSARFFHPELFRLFPRQDCSLTIEPDT
jgi:hypothetical protein